MCRFLRRPAIQTARIVNSHNASARAASACHTRNSTLLPDGPRGGGTVSGWVALPAAEATADCGVLAAVAGCTCSVSAGTVAVSGRSYAVSHQVRLIAGNVYAPERFGTIANLRS